MHLTETCEPDLPELIVKVKTTLAQRPDVKETLDLQRQRAGKQAPAFRQSHALRSGVEDTMGHRETHKRVS